MPGGRRQSSLTLERRPPRCPGMPRALACAVVAAVAMAASSPVGVELFPLRPLPAAMPWKADQTVVLVRPPKTGSKTLVGGDAFVSAVGIKCARLNPPLPNPAPSGSLA